MTLRWLCLCNLVGHAMSPHQWLERPHVGTRAMQCSEDLEIKKMGFNYSLTELIGHLLSCPRQLKTRFPIHPKRSHGFKGNVMFLAIQDSSISDIVGLSVGLLEPTNNQSLVSIKE